MAFIELLLPFSQDSLLAVRHLKVSSKPEQTVGSATLIEQFTGGILRDIMLLVIEASARAIKQNLPHLTPSLLVTSWQAIQTHQVTDFLTILRRNGVPL